MSLRRSSLLALPLLGACQPSFSEDAALLSEPQVLAVKSEPAESAPGSMLQFTALVAMPPSALTNAQPRWSFCSAPKPPTEDNAVATACLGAEALAAIGQGTRVSAVMPSNACIRFGPNPASVGARPRDADATGGYFQPLRVDLRAATTTFHLQRILCGLADASAEIAASYGREYRANLNPTLLSLDATSEGQNVDLGAVPRAALVDLKVAWSPDDAEQYAFFDREAQAITSRREAMSVAWRVSAGKMETESTRRAEGDPDSYAMNTWSAPDEPGHVKLWLVLRDSRGGSDFAEYDLTVAY